MGELVLGAIVFVCMLGLGVMAVCVILALTGAGIEKASRPESDKQSMTAASSGS